MIIYSSIVICFFFLYLIFSLQIGGVAGYVIGRRGATIRDIQRNCHVRITIDDSKVGGEIAQVSGKNKADVDTAVGKIQEAVKQAQAAPSRPAPTFSTRIDVSIFIFEN